ncbi:hypothetical protein AAC387_Pa12g0375 [Persea americana]
MNNRALPFSFPALDFFAEYILCVLLSHFWFVKTDTGIEKNTPVSIFAPVMVNNGEKPEKFNGTEFKRWQQKMLFYLTTLNFARFLNEESPALIEGETDKQVVVAVEAWKHADFLCRNYILKTRQHII